MIVECKATTEYKPVFQSQVLTYLRLSGLKLGYMINFGERLVTKEFIESSMVASMSSLADELLTVSQCHRDSVLHLICQPRDLAPRKAPLK